MQKQLENRRILVTQADTFMGPALCTLLERQGADVIRQNGSLVDPDEPSKVVLQAGLIDVLIVNLAVPAPTTPATDVDDAE